MIHEQIQDDHRIIAAGPLTRQPNSRPSRLVIVRRTVKNELVVYNQTFRQDLPADADLTNEPSDLSSGHYFQSHDLKGATEKFAHRLQFQADSFLSLNRKTA